MAAFLQNNNVFKHENCTFKKIPAARKVRFWQLVRNLPIDGELIAYLCKRTARSFEKYYPWRKFIFQQLEAKNSEFYRFSIK